MSRWNKLLERINSLSNDMRFDELKKVLESYGYEMQGTRGGSSHFTFRKAGCPPITIPKHEPIKKAYVQMVKEIIQDNIESGGEVSRGKINKKQYFFQQKKSKKNTHPSPVDSNFFEAGLRDGQSKIKALTEYKVCCL